MCESTAYVKEGGREEILLEDVELIKPVTGGFLIRNIMGEEKIIKAHIKEVNFMEHRVIFEK